MPSLKDLDLETVRKQQHLLQESLTFLYDIQNELEEEEEEQIDFREHYRYFQHSIAYQEELLKWFRGVLSK